MEYGIYITRAPEYWKSANAPITLEEWKAYVASDQEMVLKGLAEDIEPDGHTSNEDDGLALWLAHPKRGRSGVLFGWVDGRIGAANADDAVIMKMVFIASALGARVQNEDMDVFDEQFRPTKVTLGQVGRAPRAEERPNWLGWTLIALVCVLTLGFGYVFTIWAKETLEWGTLFTHLLYVPIAAAGFGGWILVGKILERVGIKLFKEVGQ